MFSSKQSHLYEERLGKLFALVKEEPALAQDLAERLERNRMHHCISQGTKWTSEGALDITKLSQAIEQTQKDSQQWQSY